MKCYRYILLITLLTLGISPRLLANLETDLVHLQKSYPGQFRIDIQHKQLIWNDGSRMPATECQYPNQSKQHSIDNPSLADQLQTVAYPIGKIDLARHFLTKQDPGRIRYEPFARKMYGNNRQEVFRHLRIVDWLPQVFKNPDGSPKYRLPVTRIQQVDKKIEAISIALEKLVVLHPEYKKYLNHPSGTFAWRNIANSNRISYHSFGMTIDLNTDYSHYWQWQIYSLYRKPNYQAITPRKLAKNALIIVGTQAYLIENGKIIKQNTQPLTIELNAQAQRILTKLKITEGEIKRDAQNHGLINILMSQILANLNRKLEDLSFPYAPNQIPWPIILLFEQQGFIWGGKWYHYDSMHFEYRPELLAAAKKCTP